MANAASTRSPRRLRLRRADTCAACASELAKGVDAIWDPARRTVTCYACASPGGAATDRAQAATTAPRSGPAGGSALAEAARRRANQAARHARIKEQRPIVGRLALALFPEPDAGRSYAKGAAGEQQLGRFLDALHPQGVLALHDRRLPRSVANIDHLVVTADAVWVVDAKRYNGRPERARGKLRVNGRDRTKLVTSVQKQVAHVWSALDAAGVEGVDVRGGLCFLDADIGLLQRPFFVDDVFVTWPKPLRKRLLEPGPLEAQHREDLHQILAAAFGPATEAG